MASLLRVVKSVVELEENLESSRMAVHGRAKRETSGGNQIENVIHELQSTLKEIERNFEQNSILKKQNQSTMELSENDPGTKCFVTALGKVNCSNVIYDNEASWKRSRTQVDMLIKVLKNKINDLKDIKKQLKEHKPSSVRYDGEEEEDEEENQSLSGEHELEQTTASTTTSTTTTTTSTTTVMSIFDHGYPRREQFNRTGFGKRPKHNGFRKRPKPPRTDDEEGTLIDMSLFDTAGNNGNTPLESAPTNSKSSHGRHRNNGQTFHFNGKNRGRNRSETHYSSTTISTSTSSPEEITTAAKMNVVSSSTTGSAMLELTEEILQSFISSTIGYSESSVGSTTSEAPFVDTNSSTSSISTEASGFDEGCLKCLDCSFTIHLTGYSHSSTHPAGPNSIYNRSSHTRRGYNLAAGERNQSHNDC